MNGRVGLVCLPQTRRMALHVLRRVPNGEVEVRLKQQELRMRLRQKSTSDQNVVLF